MANGFAGRSTLKAAAAALLVACALLAPRAASAGLAGDEDSYFYPLVGRFERTDTGDGIRTKEKGETYGLGVFFRTPVSNRIEGSPNVEEATEGERRLIATFRVEAAFNKADFTASADNAALWASTTYRGITSASGTGQTRYRILRGDTDLGYRFRMRSAASLEPFLGLGLVYLQRDLDGFDFAGHGNYTKLINARAGVRGELDLGGEWTLFGEAGLRFPLYTRFKENVAPSTTFTPGMDLSHAESIGCRWENYRLFLFHERMAFRSSSQSGLVRPKSEEDTYGIRVGIGY